MSLSTRGLVLLCASSIALAGCGEARVDSELGDAGKPTINDYEPGSPEKPAATTSAAIVNGQNASPGEYPWAVYAGGCGGTFIGGRWVMTAAHCASEFRVGDFVNIGGLRVSQMVQGNDGEWRQIVGRSCHPNYRSRSENFDFCVVELDAPSSAPAVAIDRSQSSHAGTNAVVVGWGALRQGGGSPDTLQEALVPVIDDATCRQLYGNFTENMLCAGYLQGGIDSCQGDSGGPLVSTVTGELIGIVSFGRGCAQRNAPGVYAQINTVDEWICDVTSNGADGCVQESAGGSTPAPQSSCAVAETAWLGDGYCDGWAYNTAECGFDGGDCCPGTCTPGQYNCGSNGFDCQQPAEVGVCTAPRPEYIGDGYCDRDPSYNNEACAWDGGDCCDDTCQDAQYACGSNGYQCLD